ncbi:hypothetical protein D3C87_1536280 [compost metagenome]
MILWLQALEELPARFSRGDQGAEQLAVRGLAQGVEHGEGGEGAAESRGLQGLDQVADELGPQDGRHAKQGLGQHWQVLGAPSHLGGEARSKLRVGQGLIRRGLGRLETELLGQHEEGRAVGDHGTRIGLEQGAETGLLGDVVSAGQDEEGREVRDFLHALGIAGERSLQPGRQEVTGQLRSRLLGEPCDRPLHCLGRIAVVP